MMKRVFQNIAEKGLRVLWALSLCAGLMICVPVWGQELSGIGLEIYTESSDLKYPLGETPVSLIMVVKNSSGMEVATGRGFSQLELKDFLLVTDPSGVKHVLGPENEAHKMPPPLFLNGIPWVPGENLPPDWVKSSTVNLRELVPMMKTTPGWYTVEAQMPFARYASTAQLGGIGLLVRLEMEENWEGTVNSNRIQLYIFPSQGGELSVTVMDHTVTPPQPLAQVPVRLFENSAIPEGYDLAQTWEKVAPVLTGTTNFEGIVTWDTETPCIPQGEYTAIAYHSEKYEEAAISSDEAGWADECTGSLDKEIAYEEEAPAIPGDLDGDGDVDRNDLNILLADRNKKVEDSACGEPCDLDGDGVITVLDARKMVLLCTRPRCATE